MVDNREELNRLGEKWYYMPKQGNEGARQALLEEIFILAYEMFPGSEDVISDFYVRRWHEFDPARGPLYGFFRYRLEKHKISVERRDYDGRWEMEEDDATGKERPVKKRHASMSEQLGEDGGTVEDTVAGAAVAYDSALLADEYALKVLTLMFDLKDSLEGQAGNLTRINYYRLFFTDGIVNAIHSGLKPDAFTSRERDLFRVIKETFLNFFMSSPCVCVKDIAETHLKLHGEMVEGRPMKPPGHPLPNDVYITYLSQVEHNPVTAAAVSRQRTAYRTFMKDRLLC